MATYIKENWNYSIGIQQGFDGKNPFYGRPFDIPLLLIGYSELTYGQNGILTHSDDGKKYIGNIKDFKAIKQMLEIIK